MATTVMTRVMRLANSAHSSLYRLTRGRMASTVKGLPVLLLTVAGRKSGTPHTVPCVYVDEGDSWLVAGTAGGAPDEPQWFRNLRATDHAEVEVAGIRRPVTVEVLSGPERDAAWQRFVAASPSFEDYQRKVERTMPVAVLTPGPP